MIARDVKGCVLGALQTTLKGVMDPLVIEAAAAVKAIEFAAKYGIHKCQLEGDALNIVDKINLNSQDLSAVENLIEEARFIRRNFQMCQIKYVRREANVVVHVLAKSAINTSEEMYRIEQCPDNSMSIVVKL